MTNVFTSHSGEVSRELSQDAKKSWCHWADILILSWIMTEPMVLQMTGCEPKAASKTRGGNQNTYW